MKVYIDNRQSSMELSAVLREMFEKVIKESLLVEGKSLNYEISLPCYNDEIRELNKMYRGIDSETDVLSFPMGRCLMWICPC